MMRPVTSSPDLARLRQYDRGVVRGGEVALEVDPDHVVPVGLVHVEGHLVAQDPGVVDQDVERAEGVDGLVDDVLAAGPRADVVAVDGRVAALLLDQRHHFLGRVRVLRALAVQAGADVVDDDPCALAGEDQCLFASDASSCAGDDRHLAVEQSHGDASLCRSMRSAGRPDWRGPGGGADGRRERASSVADGLVQGQNRGSDSAVTRPISATVSLRARAWPKRAVRLTTSRPGRRRSQHRRVGAAGDAQDRQRPATLAAGPGQLEHAAGDLAVERREGRGGPRR